MSFNSLPNNDKQIMLNSGRTIRFYEFIRVTVGDSRSFSIHYDTTVARTNRAARLAEATEVIDYFSGLAICPDATRSNASICSTPAQVATKELPEETFRFELSDDGSWQFAGMAEFPSRPA